MSLDKGEDKEALGNKNFIESAVYSRADTTDLFVIMSA